MHPSRLRGRRGSYFGTYTPDVEENESFLQEEKEASSSFVRSRNNSGSSSSVGVSYTGASRVSIQLADEIEAALAMAESRDRSSSEPRESVSFR